MMRHKNTILIGVGAAALVGFGFLLGSAQNAEAPIISEEQPTIVVDDSMLTPASTTDPVGQAVETPKTTTQTAPQTTTYAPAPKPTTQAPKPAATPSLPTYAVVTYDGQNFSPQRAVIRKGGTVRFVNLSNDDMWIASNLHPLHSAYPVKDKNSCSGYAFDMCKSVGKNGYWEFTFTVAGTHDYHDHTNAAYDGIIEVVDPNDKSSIPQY